MTSFSFTAAPVGVTRLVIDGEDVASRVEVGSVRFGRREPTTLTVQLVASGNAEGDALVTAHGAEDDRAAIIREFLASIDGKALDAALAQNPSMGRSIGDTVITVLSGWAAST